MAIGAIGGLVRVGTADVAEVDAAGIGPEGGVDDGDVVFADGLGVVAVVFIITFF